MTYRVLNNEEMNWTDQVTDKSSYSKMIEGALNTMEARGFTLVAIEEGDSESRNSPYYIFHNPNVKHED